MSLMLCLGACLVSSCALFSSLQPKEPKATITEVNFDTLSWTKVQMSVGLKIDNPNDFKLSIDRIEYEITVFDQSLGEGVYDQAFEIEALKSHNLKLPFTLRPVVALEVAKRFINGSEDLPVKLKAKTTVKTLLGSIDFEFEETKTIADGAQN